MDLSPGWTTSTGARWNTPLDGVYAAVHHQGSIYDSTLAAIPFLVRISGRVGLPGRVDVVELPASIGDPEGISLREPSNGRRPTRWPRRSRCS
ncbi:hypothetical protein ACRAKI_23995 [Saccharothrix isguenensis]